MIRKLIMLGSSVVLLSSVLFAQSTIGGVVKDNTGAAMVGVQVVASSPVLIAGSRTATTGGDGRYVIPNILPGTYTVTFTMQGFSTVSQQVDVPAEVTVPVDATLQVGSVGQTVQVTAQVATVDVENAAHPNVISRQEVDNVPSARNLQSIGSSIPSVHLNTPDVGGTQQIQQTYMTSHGNPDQNDAVFVDGMIINSTQADGAIVIYMDNEAMQETTYQSGDVGANASGGGVFVNAIPKEGGNTFHLDTFFAYTPSSFVGANVTQVLQERNVTSQAKITKLEDFDGSFGGPVKKDKLWFLLAGRKQLTAQQSPLGKELNGSPGIDDSYIYTGTLRLTWQATPKNKFSTMWMRMWKTALAEYVTNTGEGVAALPDATTHRTPVLFYIEQNTWSSTVTPKLLLEAGYSRTVQDYNILNQPGVYQTPFTPAWYTNTLLSDGVSGLRYNAGTMQDYFKMDRNAAEGDGVYVIGSHQIKFGVQDSWGPAYTYTDMNGDGYEIEESGVPTSFLAYDTPSLAHDYLDAEFGLYAMDVWHYKRLSITPGLRWEYLASEVQPASQPAGRWVPARSYGDVNCNTVKGMGCYKDWAPRLGVVYDLLGDHKTAIKADVGKYDVPVVTTLLNNFSPMSIADVSLTWSDPGCTGVTCVAYNSNIGANPNASFGVTQNRTLNPSFHREYDMQYNIGVQRQLTSALTGNFNWYHRSDYQQALTINSAVPASAWTPVQVQNPLNGTPITIYNLQKPYVGITPVLYQTNAPRSLRSNTYNGFETSVSGQLPRGAFLLAGWTIERQLDTDCDETANNSLLQDPNSLRFCDWTGRQYQSLGAVPALPFRSEFKLSGNAPLWFGIEANASLYSDPVFNANFNTNLGSTNSPMAVFTGEQDGLQEVNWNLSPSTRYPANCVCSTPGAVVDSGLTQGTETVLLVAPGTQLDPRLNQLDVGFRRVFNLRDRYTAIAELQTFNILNSSVPLAYSQTLGSSITPYVPGGIGGTPTSVMNPRMFRISAQFKF